MFPNGLVSISCTCYLPRLLHVPDCFIVLTLCTCYVRLCSFIIWCHILILAAEGISAINVDLVAFAIVKLSPSVVPHVCIGELSLHWFLEWLVACSASSHYMNQWWLFVNWTIKNTLQWNSNQNTKFSFRKMHLKMLSAKLWPLCPWVHHAELDDIKLY